MVFPSPEETAELKRRLAAGKKLHEVVTYFFDNFADNPEFQKAGHAREEIPRELQEAAARVIGAIWSKSLFVLQWILVEVPSMNFMHGTLTVDGKQGMVLWAPDIMVGLIAITVDPATSKTTYARISLTPASAAKTAN